MDRMLVYRDVTPRHQFNPPGWRQALWELRVLSSLRLGLELRPLDAQSCTNITNDNREITESDFPLRLTFPRNRCIRGQTASTLSFVMSIRVPHGAKIDYLSRWGFPAEKRPPRSIALSSNHCYLMLNWRRIGAKDSLNPSTANLDAQ